MGMENLYCFSMKNSLTIPSLANKNFNSLRDENDESFYTYTDPFMRNFVRNSIKGGRCNAFNQQYKPENSDEVFNVISKKLNVNANICNLLENFSEFLNKFEKLHARKFDPKYDVYRDINQDEKTEYINKKLNLLSIHIELSKLDLKKSKWISTLQVYTQVLCGTKTVLIPK